MGLDFNEALKNYFANNPNAVNNANTEAIKKALDNIAEGIDNDGTYSNNLVSIWDDPSVAMNHDVFKQKMQMITNGNASDADIDILWNILDMEDEYGNSDGILSADELGMITGSDGKVSRFSIWQGIYSKGDDIDNIASDYYNSAGPTGPTTSPTGSTNPTGTPAPTGSTNPTGTPAPTGSTNPTGTPAPTGSTNPTNTPAPTQPPVSYNGDDVIDDLRLKIEQLVNLEQGPNDRYTCPEDVIKDLEASGKYTPEQIAALRESYIEYDDATEEAIRQKILFLDMFGDGATRKDAIDALKAEGYNFGAPVKDSTTKPAVPMTTLTDSAIKFQADKLYDAMKGDNTGFWFGWGTNEDAIDDFFNDKDLTSMDKLKVIAAYPGDETFIRALDGEFNDGDEKKYCEKMVDAFIDVLENGTEEEKAEAMEILCTQVYGATAEGIYTDDIFMEVLFDKLDGKDKILNDMYEKYGQVHQGRNLVDDIKADYHGWLWGTNSTGEGYIKQIEEAMERNSRHK